MPSIYKSPEGKQAIHDRYRQFLRYWPVPNQHLRVSTGKGETFVIASGSQDAPPVILLHGTAFNSTMWMGDIAAWSQHFRVYAVDIIGDAGLSAPSRPSYASDAHALWLDDVLLGLGVEKASFVGISLGGWIALDYATRRPERAKSLVLIAPGGLASRNVLPWALPLLLLGKWGRKKMTEKISGPASANPSPAQKAVSDFLAIIFKNMTPRRKSLPDFSDESLKKLTMPVLAILAGKDVFVDSHRARAKLQSNVPGATVNFLAHSYHSITNQTQPILEFLRAAHEA
jgi:pimeloyl-ACP methyl ester carboxylesterase